METGQVIAFHSYKGGTGKTTLVVNLASLLAKNGFKICLLDLDLYAPSLCSYFAKTPKEYLNGALSGNARLSDVLIDLTPDLSIDGEFFIGLASPSKEDIQNIEIKRDQKWQLAALRQLLRIKMQLLNENKFDYILLDTSPGIRYWSINALAASDILFMLMKINDMDIVGTKKMIHEIYDSLTKFGSKNYLILNKIGGASPIKEYNIEDNIDTLVSEIEQTLGIPVFESIPCYCDLQFTRHEFLSAITRPNHPFSCKIQDIAEKIM
jgi:cellulose biosynthesis protein BcsQ